MPRKTTTKTFEDLENENKLLKSELDEIKQMLMNLNKSNSEIPLEKNHDEIEDYDSYQSEIPANKYIKVMSLTNHTLVLSTGGYGKGKVYVFNRFGQTKDIMYADLADILYSHERFAQEGKFYIMNKDVVKNHDLTDVYKNLLTKSMIENIMDFDSKKIYDFYKNASKSQQETIVSILINKLKNNEFVDFNKLNVINRLYGENLQDIANPPTFEEDEEE